MKKIGILTFIQPQNKNYGAVLQAYALSKMVQQMGYDVELIDIREAGNKATLSVSLKNYIRETMEGNPFRSFLGSQVSISKPLYSFKELERHASQYHAVIAGSDQVWRPEYCGTLALHYFLDFVPDDVKRISYAASFGLDNWIYEQPFTENVKKEIQKFKAVSVREDSGVDICKEVFEINATHAIDPTLLVDKSFFFYFLPQKNTPPPYIASFVLDRTQETEAIESYISRQTGNPIHSLNKHEVGFLGRKWTKFLMIKEWLMKLRDSEMIITDSFHCVCFSLLFQKEFICIVNKTRGLARLNSLLQSVGLQDRIFITIEQLKNSKVLDARINYSEINSRLNNQHQISFDFLKNALAE